jgi:uncharacterized protein
MAEEFMGRARELATLEAAFQSPESAFIPLYGRRRVGKSALLTRFVGTHRGIYFVGKQAAPELQLREFLTEAAVTLGEPLLAQLTLDGWGSALDAVVERWRGPGKLILAFDEFQWMAEASPELPSVLQQRWDRRWQERGDVLLILCGSYIGFMEREVLGRRSPLFGRRTAQILLRPFPFREAALFHGGYSRVDQARVYFLCGGIPAYLKRFDPRHSVETNVVRELLDPSGALHREGDFLLREELREVATYYGILSSLAAGVNTSAAIARAGGLDPRALHYYLGQLLELGYIAKRYPLWSGRPAARDVRYEIADPLLTFWFRFVSPNTSALASRGPQATFNDRVRPHLDAYFGHAFERLCREALPELYRREQVSASFEVGEFWSKDVQIDVVGLRDDGWTDLGECKWGRVESATELAREIEAKLAGFPNPRNATIGRRVFTRAPVAPTSAAKTDLRWHDLEDLYRE